MKKALILVFAALMIVPSVALAARTTPPTSHAPKVLYILKGKLSAYHAYDSVTPANGSITITINRANYHGRALHGQTLTFPVGPRTRVTLEDGVTTITDNDRGMVTIRAPRRIPAADLAATLQTYTARHIVAHHPQS